MTRAERYVVPAICAIGAAMWVCIYYAFDVNGIAAVLAVGVMLGCAAARGVGGYLSVPTLRWINERAMETVS